jgi:hypothetical protein
LACAKKCSPSLRNKKQKAFAGAKASAQKTLLGTDEKQHEGEQNQRFNERQSDKQCQLNSRTRSGVARKRLCHRAGYFALAQSG